MSDFVRSLCKIAVPVTLQGMLQASFSIVDQLMIGQLGEAGIAAVGLCGNFTLPVSSHLRSRRAPQGTKRRLVILNQAPLLL